MHVRVHVLPPPWECMYSPRWVPEHAEREGEAALPEARITCGAGRISLCRWCKGDQLLSTDDVIMVQNTVYSLYHGDHRTGRVRDQKAGVADSCGDHFCFGLILCLEL